MARRWLRLLPVLLALWLALCCGQARADNCTITPVNLVFPSVSSISTGPVYASSTFKVTCNWTDILTGLLTPNVVVCLNLGAGSGNASTTVTAPRQLASGGLRINYNLYTDATYAPAKIWGGWTGTSTASNGIVFTMTKSGGVGSLDQFITLYGKLEADANLSGLSVGPDNLTFASTFGAGSAVMNYQFSLLGLLGCAAPQTVPIAFAVQAPVINDCTINVGNLAFPNASLLTGAVRTTSSLSVTCSKNTAYRVTFNAGTYGASTTARRMRNVGNAETVNYQISNTLDGISWGDGNGGTTAVTGNGTGMAQAFTLFGMVPAQATPSPGDYKDVVTATVSF
ncbi:MAG: spore coat U domain-containing protein [Duganella sp.]